MADKETKKKKLKLLKELKVKLIKAEAQKKKDMANASKAVAYAARPYSNMPPGYFSHETIFDKNKKI